ncbi:PTS system IIB component, L-Asc family [Marinilactibacillus piezotolerans]|uniref:PTS system IIB component, L-Asc family n=1 Tax=Marinilactibacillus piezotolerans TaxID=258723 RepID=A0A1I3ZWB0_9LACT|nr:PTS sugar transporter subunit IIB [Marinilactibacillus piezotolerans]SFK47936.1 PTS system IIB component, L-Asc family [Marinilactibacillus piezotolerans]
MKILTVCGMGSGSSLIMKMNVDSILEDEGIDAEVEAIDLGSVGGNKADLIVSTQELESKLEDYDTKKIFINNIVDKEGLRTKLLEVLK